MTVYLLLLLPRYLCPALKVVNVEIKVIYCFVNMMIDVCRIIINKVILFKLHSPLLLNHVTQKAYIGSISECPI